MALALFQLKAQETKRTAAGERATKEQQGHTLNSHLKQRHTYRHDCLGVARDVFKRELELKLTLTVNPFSVARIPRKGETLQEFTYFF